MAAKVKALQQWCKMQCEGYRDVNVVNMTSSWKSGLAFCAIIHRYRPELIDYDSLSKEHVFQNNKLAFEVAQQLGIPALLDPEDMVVMTVPDKLCIITYVSQYYNFFRNYKPAASAVPMKRHLPEDSSTATAAKKTIVEKTVLEEKKSQNDLSASSKRSTLEDTCNICQGKVFLMERQIEGKKLYHRHCLRNMQKEQSSTLRSAQKLDDQQKTGRDQCREMQNESMEYDEFRSDVASGGGRVDGNAIQVPVAPLDSSVSSGNKTVVVAEVSTGATHDTQVTSAAAMNSSTEVTSAVVVTSAVGSSSISSVSFQPKAGAISSPVVTSVSDFPVSRAEGKAYMSHKFTLKPDKPVDSSEGTHLSMLTPAGHESQTSVSQLMPISSIQPAQILPMPSTSSSPLSKTSNTFESPSTQSIQVPLRPRLPPTIIPQQSGTNVHVSSSNVVPPKPPRCSVIVEAIAVESGKGPNNSSSEASTPCLSQSSSCHDVVSVASNKSEKPDCNIPTSVIDDTWSSVQTSTTVQPSQSTSAHNKACSTALSPKTHPAPNPPNKAVSMSTNVFVSTSMDHPTSYTTNLPVSVSTGVSVSTNLPISVSSNLPISVSTNLPISDSTNLPISVSTNLPISVSTHLPISTSTNLPISNPTNLLNSNSTNIPVLTSVSPLVPVTTLRSILTSKSHPAPCPPSHSFPSSTTSSLLSVKINSSSSTPSDASQLLAPGPSVSASESLSSSISTTPCTTDSSSLIPKPAVRHHISAPAVHPVSTPVSIHPVSTPAIHPVSTPAIHPVSTPAIHPVSTPAIRPVSTPAMHPVSTPAMHPVSTPASLCYPLQNPTNGNSCQNSSSHKPETAFSHSSTSHVTSTQSIKSPISHPGRTPPGRPVLPPSGLPGQIPGTSRPSPAVCTSALESSGTTTSSTSANSILQTTIMQPSASSAFPGISVVPPTTKESSEAVAVISARETNEQITLKDTIQNGGQFDGQVSSRSAVQSIDHAVGQSGSKHPPIPKRPLSISVSKELEENKHLPVKLVDALHQKLVLNVGDKGCLESKENKDPVGSEALIINGKTVDPRPVARKSVRSNPFNSSELPSSANSEESHRNLIKDQTRPDISRKETLNEIEELHFKNTGGGDSSKDVEKILVKPSPSPRSTVKLKADAPISSPTQSESTWYVNLDPANLQNESSSPVPESHATTGTKLLPNELGQGMVEETFNQQKTTTFPVPLPRSRSKKGTDDALSVNGDTPRKRLSPAPPTVQSSISTKQPLTPPDGTASLGPTRAAPPRPTPPRAESIQQARKKITPDTTFTFEDQSFNLGPLSDSRRSSDGRELHFRSSTVASNHNQPVVKRKVNAEDRLSAQYITEHLRLLDSKLKKLEREGRILEDKIRSGTDESMDDDDKNDLMGQWFEMVNHKNDLVRQESELIYRCRQQELEDKHEEVEFELRCLMNKPDHLKTANEKKREEGLLQKLLQTVTQRNNIVESMEEDRIRYLKEDEEIAQMLTTTGLK